MKSIIKFIRKIKTIIRPDYWPGCAKDIGDVCDYCTDTNVKNACKDLY